MMLPTAQEPVARQQMRRDDQMLYFMIKPLPEQASTMDRLRLQYDLARTYAAERFHITLLPFGDIRLISSQDLDLIRRAAASLQAEPFAIELNRIRGNALVGSRTQAIRHLQRALVARLTAFGVDVPDYAFNPHTSLTYQEWQQRNISVPPIGWLVGELLLINSLHGKGHQVVDRWPLERRQGCFAF